MSKINKIEKLVQKGKEGELLKYLRDKDKAVRLAAIDGMGKIGADDSFNALIIVLSENDEDIRLAAVKALGELKNKHADTHLRHLLETESNDKVIEEIKKTLDILSKEGS